MIAMSTPFKAHLHYPESRPFLTSGDSLWCDWVDRGESVAVLKNNPFVSFEYKRGDLVIVELDEYGHWHIVSRAPTA